MPTISLSQSQRMALEFADIANMRGEEKERLYYLLDYFGVKDESKLIEFALKYFAGRYEERPYKYPGDNEVYKMYTSQILKGLSLVQAHNEVIRIIDREFALADIHWQNGYGYSENFYK